MRNFLFYISFLCIAGIISCNTKKESSVEEVPFQEKHRPQVHFSPVAGWMNDPNGMVYYEGEYHLFYQHYPEASVWGPMHWGHAISKDLVHWEHLPVALYPDSLGYIFSGSAIVDLENTSGFGAKENPALIAFYTYFDHTKQGINQTQALAYSVDKGRTWAKYEKNPVVENPGIPDFRDPKVFWHEESKQWIMALAAGQEIHFYASKDCKEWTFLSHFGEGYGNHDGVWECPDMFPLKVKGSNETYWVLIVNINPGGPAGGSATQYFVGNFDGKTFKSDQKKAKWADQGKDNYAGVTWSNVQDGRTLFIGWMNNWQYAGEKPCIAWSGATTFPRELGLEKDGQDIYLTSVPVREIESLYGKNISFSNLEINKSKILSERFLPMAAPVEIKLVFDQTENSKMGFASIYGIRLKNAKGEYISIGYDNKDKLFYTDRTNAVGEVFSEHFSSLHSFLYKVDTSQIEWRLIVDMASVEFFAAGGRVVSTNVFYPSEPFDQIEVFAEDGTIDLVSGSITELKSIWK
ncbi:glycoside hydrolase family 32 protein [Massilibacteroides vaginae]|uniref:glycoside hydrolase family 32 protein n=1 Tax=Massilibacteroides vaginae TaxID=1673718 RepID=UPI000A1CAE69|nr:glycoside hydrolase family 32 protein [Massilibacteroides vaginae]